MFLESTPMFQVQENYTASCKGLLQRENFNLHNRVNFYNSKETIILTLPQSFSEKNILTKDCHDRSLALQNETNYWVFTYNLFLQCLNVDNFACIDDFIKVWTKYRLVSTNVDGQTPVATSFGSKMAQLLDISLMFRDLLGIQEYRKNRGRRRECNMPEVARQQSKRRNSIVHSLRSSPER